MNSPSASNPLSPSFSAFEHNTLPGIPLDPTPLEEQNLYEENDSAHSFNTNQNEDLDLETLLSQSERLLYEPEESSFLLDDLTSFLCSEVKEKESKSTPLIQQMAIPPTSNCEDIDITVSLNDSNLVALINLKNGVALCIPFTEIMDESHKLQMIKAICKFLKEKCPLEKFLLENHEFDTSAFFQVLSENLVKELRTSGFFLLPEDLETTALLLAEWLRHVSSLTKLTTVRLIGGFTGETENKLIESYPNQLKMLDDSLSQEKAGALIALFPFVIYNSQILCNASPIHVIVSGAHPQTARVVFPHQPELIVPVFRENCNDKVHVKYEDLIRFINLIYDAQQILAFENKKHLNATAYTRIILPKLLELCEAGNKKTLPEIHALFLITNRFIMSLSLPSEDNDDTESIGYKTAYWMDLLKDCDAHFIEHSKYNASGVKITLCWTMHYCFKWLPFSLGPTLSLPDEWRSNIIFRYFELPPNNYKYHRVLNEDKAVFLGNHFWMTLCYPEIYETYRKSSYLSQSYWTPIIARRFLTYPSHYFYPEKYEILKRLSMSTNPQFCKIANNLSVFFTRPIPNLDKNQIGCLQKLLATIPDYIIEPKQTQTVALPQSLQPIQPVKETLEELMNSVSGQVLFPAKATPPPPNHPPVQLCKTCTGRKITMDILIGGQLIHMHELDALNIPLTKRTEDLLYAVCLKFNQVLQELSKPFSEIGVMHAEVAIRNCEEVLGKLTTPTDLIHLKNAFSAFFKYLKKHNLSYINNQDNLDELILNSLKKWRLDSDDERMVLGPIVKQLGDSLDAYCSCSKSYTENKVYIHFYNQPDLIIPLVKPEENTRIQIQLDHCETLLAVLKKTLNNLYDSEINKNNPVTFKLFSDIFLREIFKHNFKVDTLAEINAFYLITNRFMSTFESKFPDFLFPIDSTYWENLLTHYDNSQKFQAGKTWPMYWAMHFCFKWLPFQLGPNFTLPQLWRDLITGKYIQSPASLKASIEKFDFNLIYFWLHQCYPQLCHEPSIEDEIWALILADRYGSYPKNQLDPGKFEALYQIKVICSRNKMYRKNLIHFNEQKTLVLKQGITPSLIRLKAILSDIPERFSPIQHYLPQNSISEKISEPENQPTVDEIIKPIAEKTLAVAQPKEHKAAQDFSVLDAKSYEQVPKEHKGAVRNFWKREAESILEMIENLKANTDEINPSHRWTVEGLWRVIHESPTFKNDLKRFSMLSENAQQACLKHALSLGGICTTDTANLFINRYAADERMSTSLASQVAPLLFHIKKHEIQHVIADLPASLNLAALFGEERKIPAIFIYFADGKIHGIPLQALFINGNFQGLLLDKEKSAVEILKNHGALINWQSTQIESERSYIFDKDTLEKLQKVLEESNEPVPPYLILNRKNYELSERARDHESKRASLKTGKRKRAPGKGKEFIAPVLKKSRVEAKKAPTTPSESALSIQKTQTRSILQQPQITGFWNKQSVTSARFVYKKAFDLDQVQKSCKPLAWSEEFIQKIGSLNPKPIESPIWCLKNYQLKALEMLACLAANQLNGFIALDMGLGKTITFAARIAQRIAHGEVGNILLITPSTPSEQTASDVIHYLEEAQFTAAISTLKNWKQIHQSEKFQRLTSIKNFVTRYLKLSPLTNLKKQERRLERIQLILQNLPNDCEISMGSCTLALERMAVSKTEKSMITESPLTLPDEIPFLYKDFQAFKRILLFRPDEAVRPLVSKKASSSDCTPQIVYATYSTLVNKNTKDNLEKLYSFNFELMIFDEAQNIHKDGIQTTAAAKKLIAQAKSVHGKSKFVEVILSTGTPIENSFTEVTTLLEISNPGCFKQEFHLKLQRLLNTALEELDKPNAFEKIIQAFLQFRILDTVLKPLIIHKSKKNPEVIQAWGGKIPNKIVRIKNVKPHVISELAFKKLEEIGDQIKSGAENISNGTRKEIYALIHKDLYEVDTKGENYKEVLAKIKQDPQNELRNSPLTSALINNKDFIKIIDSGKEALIFTHFKVATAITQFFINIQFKQADVRILDGKTKDEQRAEIIHWMQSPPVKNQVPRVLIISLQTGGVGLNFPEIEKSFFLTGSFNPSALAQAEDRIVRAGNEGERIIFHFNFNTVAEKHKKIIIEKKQAWTDFLLSAHLPKNTNDFDIEACKKHLEQFIKILIAEKVHLNFLKTNYVATSVQRIAEICDYFESNRNEMEARFNSMLPKIPTTSSQPAIMSMERTEEQPVVEEKTPLKSSAFKRPSPNPIQQTTSVQKLRLEIPKTIITQSTEAAQVLFTNDIEKGSTLSVTLNRSENSFQTDFMEIDEAITSPRKAETAPTSRKRLRENIDIEKPISNTKSFPAIPGTLPQVKLKTSNDPTPVARSSPPKTLSINDYLVIPYPKSNLEDISALGTFLYFYKNNMRTKEDLKLLATEQKKNATIRSMIRDGFLDSLPASLGSFYREIASELETHRASAPCIAFYNQKQCYELRGTQMGQNDQWILIRKSQNKNNTFCYDLLIPKSFYDKAPV